VPDDDVDKAGAADIPSVDTILFGRRTYELFEAFWPHVANGPGSAPDPHMPRRTSPEMRAMATMLNESTKLVFSTSLTGVTWKNSRLLHQLDPDEIRTLKTQPGKDIIIFGSGSVVSQLTEHGLIDEYQFVVSPVVLGSGSALISGVSTQLRLDLQETRKYRSGNVMLRYKSMLL
jgi:dihydrofolate reductase